MSDLSKLKNINISFKKNGKFLGFGSSPGADWEVVFIVTALLTTLMIVGGAYLFVQVGKGELGKSEESVEATLTLDEKRLDATVEYYESKAEKFETLRNSRVNLADPSI